MKNVSLTVNAVPVLLVLLGVVAMSFGAFIGHQAESRTERGSYITQSDFETLADAMVEGCLEDRRRDHGR